MSEPIITPAAIYTFGGVVGAGHLLGMPVDAVVLGAVASAAVTMISEPKSRWLVVAYTIIGGLLGGAFAPPLTHFLIGEAIGSHPSLGEQVLLKFARTVWPSFENHADDIVEWLLNLLPWRPKK